jgi:hypothetical protein
MARKEFKIDELEERIAPSSLNVGSILGGTASAANGSPNTSVGSVGNATTGQVASGNAVSPALDALHGNTLDALHSNSVSASGGNVMGNSPSTSLNPTVSPDTSLNAGDGLL